MNACTNKQKADIIVKNGTIYTVDETFTKVEAFAVIGGKITATGTTEEILKQFTSENIVNASGKFIYPGFNDAHCHFNGYAGNLLQYADLRGTISAEEVYAYLEAHHEKYGGECILGRNWDQNDLEVK